jgi:hypothetical protein
MSLPSVYKHSALMQTFKAECKPLPESQHWRLCSTFSKKFKPF